MSLRKASPKTGQAGLGSPAARSGWLSRYTVLNLVALRTPGAAACVPEENSEARCLSLPNGILGMHFHWIQTRPLYSHLGVFGSHDRGHGTHRPGFPCGAVTSGMQVTLQQLATPASWFLPGESRLILLDGSRPGKVHAAVSRDGRDANEKSHTLTRVSEFSLHTVLVSRLPSGVADVTACRLEVYTCPFDIHRYYTGVTTYGAFPGQKEGQWRRAGREERQRGPGAGAPGGPGAGGLAEGDTAS